METETVKSAYTSAMPNTQSPTVTVLATTSFQQLEAEQRQQLRQMRGIATGLLLAMTGVFVASLVAEKYQPDWASWLGYVRAFAEAAMVGALADWFAVTALFKRPLGLPIPHTAIIKTNKDRIGASLGNFVEKNFLTPEVIATRLGTIDMPQKAAEWLTEGENAKRLAERITGFVPDVLNAVGGENVQKLIEDNITARLKTIDIAPLTGNLLATLTAENRHQGLLDEALKIGEKLLHTNKDFIRQKIHEESPWYVPSFVDDKIYEKIISRAEETLRAMNADPHHELRRQFHRAMQDFIQNLRTSPEYRAKAESLRDELLGHPVVRQYFSSLWSDVKAMIIDDVEQPDSAIRRQLERSIVTFGEKMLNDNELRNRLNTWIQTLVQTIIAARRNEIASLIADTVKNWDGDTMSERIELYVGKDLQYIRINGTVVGGLVGLCIYAISQLFR
jgi:uncharacterized membrane-anchored protein YjiN (DUF445 family)